MILGKFMPLHLGHKYLIDFALNFTDRLTILVCSIPSEPIPGKLRYQWVKEMFPEADVIHVDEQLPQEPCEHPDFWQIWHDLVKSRIPCDIDYCFASEDYGWKLAEVIGAEYVPVDHGRVIVPVSGSMIREYPMINWKFLPSCVRPFFLKRICIFGPESTGKSTLTRQLAEHYDTVCVDEYARALLDFKDGRCDKSDIELIARGQIASEDALAQQAEKVLFCDTDLITTCIWSDILFNNCPEWLKKAANERIYDLYLVTDIDIPWEFDNQRYLPDKRPKFLDRCIYELKSRSRPFVKISGDRDTRFNMACQAVDRLLN